MGLVSEKYTYLTPNNSSHHLCLSFTASWYLLYLTVLPWSGQCMNSRTGFYFSLHLSIPAACPRPGSQYQSSEYQSHYNSHSCMTSYSFHYCWKDGIPDKLPQDFSCLKNTKILVKPNILGVEALRNPNRGMNSIQW